MGECEYCGAPATHIVDGIPLCEPDVRVYEMESVFDSYYENRTTDEPIDLKAFFEAFSYHWLDKPMTVADLLHNIESGRES